MTVIAKLSAARQVYGGLPLRTVLGMALQRAGATEIRALDPGTERTGFCAVAAEGWRAFTFPTLTIQHYLRQGSWGADRSEVAWMIERLSGQGRRAFPEVVQGAFVAGQFWECLAGRGRSVTMIYREAIRAKLLGNASKGERAGDSAIYRRLRVMAAGKVER